jgi:hypothetical protein
MHLWKEYPERWRPSKASCMQTLESSLPSRLHTARKPTGSSHVQAEAEEPTVSASTSHPSPLELSRQGWRMDGREIRLIHALLLGLMSQDEQVEPAKKSMIPPPPLSGGCCGLCTTLNQYLVITTFRLSLVGKLWGWSPAGRINTQICCLFSLLLLISRRETQNFLGSSRCKH